MHSKSHASVLPVCFFMTSQQMVKQLFLESGSVDGVDVDTLVIEQKKLMNGFP